MVSYEELIEEHRLKLQTLGKAGNSLIGYIFPHAPVELFIAHKLLPTLLRADPKTSGGYEGSLQTFCCAYARNLFSQRATGRLPPLAGIVFAGGTCDSLQNVADVWKLRFPQDMIFRLAYPAAAHAKGAVEYFAEELRNLSQLLEAKYKQPFSAQRFMEAVDLSSRFHAAAQFLVAARLLDPQVLPYEQLAALVRRFLTAPDSKAVTQLESASSAVQQALGKKQCSAAEVLQQGLLKRQLKDIPFVKKPASPRIMVIGGMVDPQALATLIRPTTRNSAEVVLDMLSFGFRTIFAASPQQQGDPFQAMARALLDAPTEPTQEGLPNRLAFLEEMLRRLRIDGLLVCEQSFCDPDEFEAPSLSAVAAKVGLLTTRLQLDPELSDRARVEGKIHSFLETINTKR
jgi:benzoyl-CoA reductase/2-hydroxyglutaryl-CoA dehydratase subunit BcrC/BadD/HgdB